VAAASTSDSVKHCNCKCTSEAPSKTESLRTFNVFVDGEYFEVGVDEVGGSPMIAYAQQFAPVQTSFQTQGLARHSVQQMPSRPAPPKLAVQPALPKTAPQKTSAPATSISSSATMSAASPTAAAAPAVGELKAPMPGMIIKYEKAIGQSVKKGDIVVVLEAMKMENGLPSPVDGVVKSLNFGSGDSVPKGAVLAVIE
ncbi:MAG: hypothetical protein HQK67_01090, partial [Desulfamplus sp.]|nr:hypothetical protein [Desulfamplus sp.]